MATLQDLSKEYRQNIAAIKRRIGELEDQVKHTRSKTTKYKLQRRIKTLRTMLGESTQTAFELEHYYDEGKGNSAE